MVSTVIFSTVIVVSTTYVSMVSTVIFSTEVLI